jgi:hypothetical protein
MHPVGSGAFDPPELRDFEVFRRYRRFRQLASEPLRNQKW